MLLGIMHISKNFMGILVEILLSILLESFMVIMLGILLERLLHYLLAIV